MGDYEVANSLAEVINNINLLRPKVNVDQKVWKLIDLMDVERKKYFDHYVSDNYGMGFTVMDSYYSEKNMKTLVELAREILVRLSITLM